MQDGERVSVRGSRGDIYVLSRFGQVYACTCPAWQKQRTPNHQRSCKHLQAQLGAAHEQERLATAQARVAARQRSAAARTPAGLRPLREAGLRAAQERFPAAAERMRAVYDMPLPRHLTFAAAFWLGLSPDEREDAWAYLGCGPAGVLEWFADDGLMRPAILDERLHFRYRCDPPEFVTVWSGNSDGGHWGLWYDDPRELPRLLAHNYARDDGCSGAGEATLLGCLLRSMEREELPAEVFPHAPQVQLWLKEMHHHELAAHREEGIRRPPKRSASCVAGMDPWLPNATLPVDLVGYAAQERRYRCFREAPAEASAWIDQARAELAAGAPLRALFLGRELHYVDTDPLREATSELLIAAYRALGRDALAEVVRVHHAHRDLPSVGIYGPTPAPPRSPLADAAMGESPEQVATLLAAGATQADAEAAFAAAWSCEVLTLLLPHVRPEQIDTKIAAGFEVLQQLAGLPDVADVRDAAIDLLLAHTPRPERAFARALATGLVDRAQALAGAIDLRARDEDGATPLHHAAGAGAAEIVAQLLARGADPEAKDTLGATPRDRARALWQEQRAASLAVLALLQPRTQTPAARTGPIAIGEQVTHERFGDGVVEASEGEGEAIKLRVRFADTTRTLLARFLRRSG